MSLLLKTHLKSQQKNKKDCKNSLAPEVSKGQAASLSAQ